MRTRDVRFDDIEGVDIQTSQGALALLSGIEVNTSASDFTAVKDMNLMRFDEDSWQLFGRLVRARASE